MTREDAIKEVKDVIETYECDSFKELYYDSCCGNYDNAYYAGVELGRANLLIEFFNIKESEVFK